MKLSKYQFIKFIFLFHFLVIIDLNEIKASSTCSIFLSKNEIGLKDFEKRINKKFRQLYTLKERALVSPQLQFSIFRPFSVSEGKYFFPNGELPKLVSPNEVIIFNLSRAEGIQRIREGVLLDQERAWIFVPSLQIWIYDSVNYAGSRTVGSNGLLKDVLIYEFGDIELFHTHPHIVVKEIYFENDSYRRNGISLDQFKATAALPSLEDIDMLFRTINLDKGEAKPKSVGHIVHELGLTTYSFQAFPYISKSGERTGVYPAITTWSFTEGLNDESLTPSEKIRLMFQLSEAQSTKAVSCMWDICKWTPESAPKLILKHTDFETE